MFARSGTVTVRICVVWTLLDLLVGTVAHPRSRVFHRQSANPYAAVRGSVVCGVFYHKPANYLGDLGNDGVP